MSLPISCKTQAFVVWFLSQYTCFSHLFLLEVCFQPHTYTYIPLVTCFPALFTRYLFSRAFHQVLVFPRFSPRTCFPALATSLITQFFSQFESLYLHYNSFYYSSHRLWTDHGLGRKSHRGPFCRDRPSRRCFYA